MAVRALRFAVVTANRGAVRDGGAVPEFVVPAEALLVGNLEVPEYVEVVLGSLAELPQRLAEVAQTESFASWKARQQPCKVGQLPRSFLRRENFLTHLLLR